MNQHTSKNPRIAKIKRLTGEKLSIHLLVDYTVDQAFCFAFATELRAGGMFIEIATPCEVGARLALTFTLPDTKETITTGGRVLWVQEPLPHQSHRLSGMEVQFDGLNEDLRKVLAQFIKRYRVQKIA